MSKTFTSRNDGMKNNIVVKSSGGGVHLTVTNHDLKQFGCDISSPDAPALALAILEAAGVESAPFDSATSVQIALGNLREHVGIEVAKAKEAADREALEAEALELFKAFSGEGADVWENVTERAQQRWAESARKAREMYKAKS